MVDLNEVRLAADLELVFELSVFDAAADVSEGEDDLAGFEDDGLLFGRWWLRFDG